MRFRRDKNALTVFNDKTGTKLRLTIGKYTKAKAPELVDIKITDFCLWNCTFCLDPSTLITMDDFSQKTLESVVVGDKIIGFNEFGRWSVIPTTIEAKVESEKEAFRISFSDGKEIIASEDHKFLTACSGWKTVKELKLNTRIRSYSPTAKQTINDKYRLGYISGFTCGDGNLKNTVFDNNGSRIEQDFWRVSCSEKYIIETLKLYVEIFANIFRPLHKNRNTLRINKNGWNGDKSTSTIINIESVGVRRLVDIQTESRTFWANGLATHNCYQGSTPLGKHATNENMQFIINELAKAKVFEVAIGGGEPTDYPDFINILKAFKDKGIVPNFTTKSMGWVKRNWNEVKDTVGAFAFSAETVKDLNSANMMFEDIPRDKINIHYIMGLQDKLDFFTFLRRASELNFRVTLLGYKTTGRGKDLVPYNYDWWIDVVNLLVSMRACPSLSIDTPLAQQYDGIMPVGKQMYHTKEGFVSAYIDAVAMTIGASSFEDLDNLQPFDSNWLNTYKEIKPT